MSLVDPWRQPTARRKGWQQLREQLRASIRAELAKSAAPLTTKAIADKLDEEPQMISRVLRVMHDEGAVTYAEAEGRANSRLWRLTQ